MRTPVLLATGLLLTLAGCSATNSRLVTKMNTDAAIAGDIPIDPLNWRVITSGADRKNSTMFTVFGNDAAVQYARTNAGLDYPAGSAIALVTWHQQEDSRWFGGRIPAGVELVELLDFRPPVDGGPPHLYRAYEGSPLKEAKSSEGQVERRAAYILSLRAAVMP